MSALGVLADQAAQGAITLTDETLWGEGQGQTRSRCASICGLATRALLSYNCSNPPAESLRPIGGTVPKRLMRVDVASEWLSRYGARIVPGCGGTSGTCGERAHGADR